VRALEGTVPLT